MAIITKSIVRNQLLDELVIFLRDKNFKKHKEGVLRKFKGGFNLISCRIIDYWPLSQNIESPLLSTRFDVVEDIVYKFISDDMFNHEFAKATTTIHKGLAYSAPTANDDIQINDELDLKKAIEEIKAMIKNDGLPFFDTYKDLASANIYKKKQILDDLKASNTLINLMQSLTLMKLCNDPDFDNLKDKYKELYVPFVGEEVTGRKALDDLIEYLENQSWKEN